jgi:hypothetical protein
MAVFNIHEVIEKLIASGVTKKQAELIIEAVIQSDSHLTIVSDLELERIIQKMELLKVELAKVELIKVKLLKWIIPMFLVNLLLIIGLWFK